MKYTNLNPIGIGIALSVVSAVTMLLLGVFSHVGIYEQASHMMMGWHMFYSPSPLGILTGMIEAAVLSFIGGYFFAIIYNHVSKSS